MAKQSAERWHDIEDWPVEVTLDGSAASQVIEGVQSGPVTVKKEVMIVPMNIQQVRWELPA